jgi:hypothetical protein
MGDGSENNVWGRKLTKIYRSVLCFCPQIRRKGNGGFVEDALARYDANYDE